MDDLTLMYISASRMPEKWVKYHTRKLLEVVGNTPIISVTRKPFNLGINLIDNEKKCYWNIYIQMLRATKLVRTPYVAMVEDDTLYSKEHFTEFRPDKNTVSYNKARWSLFSWVKDPDLQMYCMRQRVSNCSLIAPTKYLVEALTERHEKHPNGVKDRNVGEVGRPEKDHRLKVSKREMVVWYSTVPVIQLNHHTGTDIGGGPGRSKRHGQIKAYDIPHWGKAREIISEYC